MVVAPVPDREAERLACLQSLGTAAVPALDDAARIAAALVRMPVGFVSVVGHDKVWFKGRYGLEVSEAPRHATFCSHAILDPTTPFVVEDATLDPRFADNPFVTGHPKLRFYAGIPILGGDGVAAVGVLCVIDWVSRKLSADEIELLRTLGRAVERHFIGSGKIAALASTLDRLEATESMLERTKEHLYDAIESLDAGLVMHDAEGALILSNRDYNAMAPHIDALRGSEIVVPAGASGGDVILVDGDHRLGDRWVRASSQRTGAGALVSLLTDITASKKTHDQLLVARDAAEEAARAKARFLATMSHEIRTPMNGVIGMTALLGDTTLSSEQREYVETIRNCGDALLELINDILDFSKIEAGKLLLEEFPFDPRALIEAAAAILVVAANTKGIRLVTNLVGIRHSPKGDPMRLRQILVNLIGNAVKFTAEGEVVVTASTEPSEGGGVLLRVSVRDTGVGIPAAAIPRLFEAFSQADYSTTRKFGGTGLGLAISRNLLSLMGGTLEVESVEGVGSCFSVVVDLPAADEHRPPVPRFDSCRALCVEGNEEERKAICAELSDLGFAVEEAGAAPQALARLLVRGTRPLDACVVAESLLGESEELLSQLDNARFDGLKVIVATGHVRRSAPIAPQFNARIAKPLRRPQVIDVLSACMRESRSRLATRVSSAPAPVTWSSEGRTGRALIVEDNEVNARIAGAMLQRLGWMIERASDGVEALQILERSPFEMVWMDCQMPRMDGYSATRELRMRERERGSVRMHIVGLTANAIAGDREACLAAGMDDYVAKPLRRADLERAIEHWRGLAAPSRISEPPEPEERAG